MHVRRWMLCAAAFALTYQLAPRARAQRSLLLPIRFHVVHVDGQPVVARSFIEAQLEHANAIFGAYGVRFAKSAAPAPLPAEHAALESRADRDALGRYAAAGAIDCFVVRSLRDVDEPARMRRGVHWHAQAPTATHFVVLSSIAGADVLAHELGHYLGNHAHSDTPGNLMSYQRGPEPPRLDADQLRRMRATIRAYLRRGELRELR